MEKSSWWEIGIEREVIIRDSLAVRGVQEHDVRSRKISADGAHERIWGLIFDSFGVQVGGKFWKDEELDVLIWNMRSRNRRIGTFPKYFTGRVPTRMTRVSSHQTGFHKPRR